MCIVVNLGNEFSEIEDALNDEPEFNDEPRNTLLSKDTNRSSCKVDDILKLP